MRLPLRRKRALLVGAIIAVFGLWYFRSYGGPLGPYLFSSSAPESHWFKLPERYPVSSTIPLPTGEPISIPKIQASPRSEDAAARKERLRRRAAVQESFLHCWKNYKNQAWMKDELLPISGGGRNNFGGWGATLVDSLDTLWIMDMKDDFETAVKASGLIDFTTTTDEVINVFETTIRYLGGFLAAYDLSEAKYPLLLQKATEVGDLLMSCFDTPNRMPITRWNWHA
jgi:mannosyl-oligosaccharide alpha-1,2-mannosidase